MSQTMPTRRKREYAVPSGEMQDESHLRSIRGGKREETSAVEDLFSGRVSTQTGHKRKKSKEVPPQELPSEIKPLANLFTAGKTLVKEITFKLNYAKQKIDHYCLQDWAKRFIAGRRRPSSTDYITDHSRFKFVLTSRTTLTFDKIEELKNLGLPIDQHTQLKGVEINYSAIKQHGLEEKLKSALEQMHVKKSIIEECFLPKVELKETFYDLFFEIVQSSLQKGEKIEEKMLQVLEILSPATQIRNTEAVDLSLAQCLNLVQKTEIETDADFFFEDEDDGGTRHKGRIKGNA